MDPRDPNNRIHRLDPNAPRKQPPRQPGPPRVPQRVAPLRPQTGPLRPVPTPSFAPESSDAPSGGLDFRLDPNSPPGEFNFILPPDAAPLVPTIGLIAEADGPIPPQLVKAVDEVLGFIFGLDQQFENQGRRPKR